MLACSASILANASANSAAIHWAFHCARDFRAEACQFVGNGDFAGVGLAVVLGDGNPPFEVFHRGRQQFGIPLAGDEVGGGEEVRIFDVHRDGHHAAAGLAGGVEAFVVNGMRLNERADEVQGGVKVGRGGTGVIDDDFVVFGGEDEAGIVFLCFRRCPDDGAVALVERRGDDVAGHARVVHKEHQRVTRAGSGVFRREQVVAHGFAGGGVGVFVWFEVVEDEIGDVPGFEGVAANLDFCGGGFEGGGAVVFVADFAGAVFRGVVFALLGGTAFFDGKQRAVVIGIQFEDEVTAAGGGCAVNAVAKVR